MNIPEALRYTRTHEWASESDDGVVTVGISDFAQEQLGDVVFVELPTVGHTVAADDAVAVVESVKTASDIHAPVSGKIVDVNGVLEQAPEAINEAPYEGGWLFRIELADPAERSRLLDATAYRAVCEEEA